METEKSTGAINDTFKISPERLMQLQAQAQQEVSRNIDEEAMLAQFRAEALEKATASLRARAETEVKETLAKEGRGNSDAHGFSKLRHKIFIHESPLAGEPKKQFLSVNGYAWLIERGVHVIVPPEVLEVLNHAITENTIQSEGGLLTRPAHRFPYQDFGLATDADKAEFEEAKRTAGLLRVA